MQLFTGDLKGKLRPARIQELVMQHCPELSRSIVCVADRKLYRQAPKQVPFLL